MRATIKRLDRRRFLALGGAMLLAGRPSGVAAASPVAQLSGRAFGTSWTVSASSGVRLSPLQEPLDALLRDIDLAFSPWRQDSLISRFNDARVQSFPVGGDVIDVTRSALSIARESDGHFDPTVGPLVSQWGFGPIHGGAASPAGWRDLEADDGSLAKKSPGLTLDLCGIAKGYGLDRMVDLIAERGMTNFVVEFGGEIAARGRHPAGRGWQVGIEDPRQDALDLFAVLELDTMSVATSGDRANGYDFNGRRFSHIIDPATREPVAGALASVSVLMPRAREADGWATALMAAGAGGPELAARNDIAALFLMREAGGIKPVLTGAFERYLV